jgi:hypothetical protein
MPRLLELFSGTGSVGKSFRDKGWEVTSVDLDPKSGAMIITDVAAWDYKVYEPGYFHCIWASPPCTHYSIARTTAKTPRDLEGSDRLVQIVRDIIDYHKPLGGFFMENPQTGLLKNRFVVNDLSFHDTSYCKYGYLYKKATRIWHNCRNFKPRKACCAQSPCNVMDEFARHPQTAQRGPGRIHGELKVADKCSLHQLYSMPKELCDEIAEAATHEFSSYSATVTNTPHTPPTAMSSRPRIRKTTMTTTTTTTTI